MALRGNMVRRSLGEWIGRLILAGFTAVVGIFSVTVALSQVLVASRPAMAHALAPYDGRITGSFAASLAPMNGVKVDRHQAVAAATAALRQDPGTIPAIAQLGLAAEMQGNRTAARRWFGYAQRLSRRDLTVQLWSIEDAVSRGDVPDAMRWYDITMRVSPKAVDLLSPVLAKAAGEPAIRTELIKTLARKPNWGENFIVFLSEQGPDPRVTASVLSSLHRAGVGIPSVAQSTTINALIAAGHPDAAWTYYSSIRQNVDRRRSRDPGFTADLDTPSQLDWAVATDAGPTATLQKGQFDFVAPSGTSGPMLQQYQVLPPGIYRLNGHSADIDEAGGAQPYWALMCRDGGELGRVEVPFSKLANGRFDGNIRVPAHCPVQVLILYARPSEAIGGSAGRIDRMLLSPVDR